MIEWFLFFIVLGAILYVKRNYRIVKIERCSIYGISLKGKREILYIGSTNRDINKRLKEHISKSSHNNAELYKLGLQKQLEIKRLKTCLCDKRYDVEYKLIDEIKPKLNIVRRK